MHPWWQLVLRVDLLQAKRHWLRYLGVLLLLHSNPLVLFRVLNCFIFDNKLRLFKVNLLVKFILFFHQ